MYFVIGRFNSAGTVDHSGLLIGMDMMCDGAGVVKDELSLWKRNNFSPLTNLPYTVAHELIHFQQGAMEQDTSLLAAVIFEGMADFIGELISGKTSNERLKSFANSPERRKQIWTEFKKEMYLQRDYNWIGNGQQETTERPADLGYWIGYQICKAYYEEAEDKRTAIHEMLHLKDYKAFYAKSKVEEKLGL